ncbi:L,D-transpeptidase family protein [Bdellovibrio sp. HCB337]|uniref:L,D-transpeptidase family protein n=1 Tax=Bdellovibrio sp. HCB337 TaxID=3394358 RepID=UPI0039A490B8
MKKIAKLFLGLVLALPVTATAADNICNYQDKIQKMPFMSDNDFKSFLYSGQEIDQILVSKDYRRIYFLKDQKVIRSYPAAFGFPRGAKRFQGDLRTPEGVYYISKKKPDSAYTLALEVSYPNKQDIEYARSRGKSPGGDIMIHGLPSNRADYNRIALIHPKDWTLGCVAVNSQQIREAYDITAVRTPITICPMK